MTRTPLPVLVRKFALRRKVRAAAPPSRIAGAGGTPFASPSAKSRKKDSAACDVMRCAVELIHRGGPCRLPAPGGGFLTGFGAPVVNDGAVIAFPAVVKLGPALGAIFIAPARASLVRLVRHGRSGTHRRHLRPVL
jgi:hypothetical protein